MKKVLLSFKNLSNSKDVFNFITLRHNEDIHIVGLSDNYIETMALLYKYVPDLLLIDSESFAEINLNLLTYLPTFYIDDESKLLNESIYNSIFIKIYNNFDHLFSNFKTDQKSIVTKKIETKIIRQLKDLNFNFKQAGTRFFLETLIFVYENKNPNILNNISKNIYPNVSNKYHTSISKVKWNIEKSISYMYNFNLNNYPGLLDNYLSFDFTQKPTTKELIVLLNKLL